jgi:geranylgeranyl pyrophosphate synthase
VWSVLLADRELSPAHRLELLELMSETVDHTHIGQALDIEARAHHAFTMAQYERLVREKTGYYLAAPMLGAAVVAQAPAVVREALRSYGHHLGPMFQITDDLLDLTAGKGRGGAVGSDIREGKRSFLVAVALERAGVGERDELFRILDAPRGAVTDGEVEWAIRLFEETGAVEAARMRCATLLAEGLGALEAPGVPGALREALTLFATALAARRR